jgi:alpha-D-xyloside xylohydrolase
MYQSLLDTVHLRYRLLPCIYSEAWQVTANRSTLMRALPMDFPDDKAPAGRGRPWRRFRPV